MSVPVDIAAELAAALPDRVEIDGSVGALCTYRVGGSADVVVTANSVADLETLRSVAGGRVRFLAVGAGSNLLVSDAGFPGVAVRLGGEFTSVEIDEDRAVVGGAAMLPRVARQLVAADLGGFEWAVGVPGTIGGAVRMNAGGHGSDMAASVGSVSVFNLESGGPTRWDAADCGFGYRTSRIGSDDLVLFAELVLDRGASPDLLSEIVAWRRANQPGGQNAGSVFANPSGDSAGRLIDAAGLKGHRIGTAAVSEKHANFIQADPGGAAEDVVAVIRFVQQRIRELHNIELRVENHLIGFDQEWGHNGTGTAT